MDGSLSPDERDIPGLPSLKIKVHGIISCNACIFFVLWGAIALLKCYIYTVSQPIFRPMLDRQVDQVDLPKPGVFCLLLFSFLDEMLSFPYDF